MCCRRGAPPVDDRASGQRLSRRPCRADLAAGDEILADGSAFDYVASFAEAAAAPPVLLGGAGFIVTVEPHGSANAFLKRSR